MNGFERARSTLALPYVTPFFASNFIQFLCGQIAMLAMQWLITDLTESRFLITMVAFAQGGAVFLFSPVAGLITDRTAKRRLLIISRMVLLVIMAIIGSLVISGEIRIAHVWMCSIAGGLAPHPDGLLTSSPTGDIETDICRIDTTKADQLTDDGSFAFIHGLAAASLAAGDFDSDGSDELAITFTGAGTWIYDDDTGNYKKIHPFDAPLMTTGDLRSDGGDQLGMTFAGFGMWIYDDLTGSFSNVHGADPTLLTAW